MQKCTHSVMKAAGLLALRIIIAVIFFYVGVSKVNAGHEMASGMFASLGLPGGGSLWAYIIGILEILGGIMVLLGVFARYAAGILSIILIVAMATIHRGGPFEGYFLPLILLGGTLAILGGGAGKWRLVKTECCCNACKSAALEMAKPEGCCGQNCGGCEDKK